MWDFQSENTKTFTHGFHTYPAMMIPQVAKKLIKEYGKKASLIFDPYCGTGTSLVESNIAGIEAIGSDLNPLARLLTKVKTTPIELQTLKLHLVDFDKFLFKYRFGFNGDSSVIIPEFDRIDFWFSKDVKQKLAVIRKYVEEIENKDIKDFFLVALSQTIRDTSWTRNNEFKLYKMSPEQIKSFSPDPYSRMEFVLGRNYKGMEDFLKHKKGTVRSTILDINTCNDIEPEIISKNQVDLIVTSPPYGDSSTTVAYGQFSALANQWLGFMENGRTLDKILMGGIKANEVKKFSSKALNRDIKKIDSIDPKRVLDVVSFFNDYESSINNISKVVKPKGKVCYVVSNRTVRGVQISTHEITKDFFSENGFIHVDTFTRKISGKRMPRQNSPKGVTGQKTNLMNNEYIVVLQKK